MTEHASRDSVIPRRCYPAGVGSPPARHVLKSRGKRALLNEHRAGAGSQRPRWAARRMRRLRHIRARPRRRPPLLLRPLRAPAPRPGVGRDRHLRGRPHHHDAGLRPRLPGLRRGEAAGARGRHGDRPRALLDHRRRLLGERAAGLARRRPRAGARPQRQPDQRGRALERAEGERHRLPRHLRLGDHRRAALLQRGPLDRGRGRRRDAAARGRLLDRGDDQARDRRLPRPARRAAALARAGSASASSSPPRAAPSTSSAPS